MDTLNIGNSGASGTLNHSLEKDPGVQIRFPKGRPESGAPSANKPDDQLQDVPPFLE